MKKSKKISIIVYSCLFIASVIGILTVWYDLQYQKAKEQSEPFPLYTEYKLTRSEFDMLTEYYHLSSEPDIYELWDDYDAGKELDFDEFASMKFIVTEDTEKAVAEINRWLFEYYPIDEWSLKVAASYGITAQTPMTTDWLKTHPKEAVEIMATLPGNGRTFLHLE